MTPNDLYLEARKRGLQIEAAGDKLAVFPKGKCPPDFANVLREHKEALLNWLNTPRCHGWRAVPPAGLALNRLRPSMDSASARRVMSYVCRQISGPDELCEWCLRREL